MRRRKHPLEAVAEWFQILGIDFVAVVQAAENSGTGIVQAFADCKTQAKGRFKQLALEHHPDRGGDVERFKGISEAWNQLQKITMRLRPPVPVTQIRVHVTMVSYGVTNPGTTTGGW